ncbi:prepilin peptidase [Paenibacillus sp. TRM 82003]|nr:prepilin peptidase [Paenibacillus sp. TRM 82003]
MKILISVCFLAFLLLSFALDVSRRRLPNHLTGIGTLCGCALHTWDAGWQGAAFAAVGAAAGLGIALPLWLLSAIGAGDAKWFGAAGAWLGASAVATLAMGSLFVAGIAGCIYFICSPGFRSSLLERLWTLWITGRSGKEFVARRPSVTGTRFPFMAAVLPGALCLIPWHWGMELTGGWL